jgi:hypothetical protein
VTGPTFARGVGHTQVDSARIKTTRDASRLSQLGNP